jgi:hypothetical protein
MFQRQTLKWKLRMKPVEVEIDTTEATEVTVTAYKAKDGKLFLERKERDEYNKKLFNKELVRHIAQNCDRSDYDDNNCQYPNPGDIAKYFEEHFEEIAKLVRQ